MTIALREGRGSEKGAETRIESRGGPGEKSFLLVQKKRKGKSTRVKKREVLRKNGKGLGGQETDRALVKRE